MGDKNTWTIGGLIADAVRRTKAGQSAKAILDDVRSRGFDPKDPEYIALIEAMPAMEGEQTTSGRGRHGASERLSKKDRKAADKLLKRGRRR